MLVTRSLLASIVLLIGISNSPVRAATVEASADVLSGVRWAGSPVSLQALRGKTVVLVDYATWCPKCNKWSGEVCKQLKEFIQDKPVVVLAINNDDKPGNVLPYLEARNFLAPNIVHGYDANIAKRNGLPDLWGYMIIDPEGKIIDRGQLGSYFGGDADKVFAVTKKLQERTMLGEFMVIDGKMPEALKKALWPMELGQAAGAEVRKFNSDQKKQVEAALTKYGAKELENIRQMAEGDIETQLAAYDRAAALGLQLKGSGTAKEAKKVVLQLEADAKFKRELTAKKAYEKCERMPANSSARVTALKGLAKRFDGTTFGEKAKEAVASAGVTGKPGK